jgi:hypothetical protein
MSNLGARIFGAVFLVAGAAAVIVHYVVNRGMAFSYITLAIAAVLLVAGVALFNRGAGVHGFWRAGKP